MKLNLSISLLLYLTVCTGVGLVPSSAHAVGVPFSGPTTGADSQGARSVEVVDLDADGDLDILFASSVSNDVAWLENVSGDGTVLSKRMIDPGFGSARVATAADVDGDGDLDVLGTSLNRDDVVWWENNALVWTKHEINPTFNGARGLAAADFDLDGDIDVVATAWVADDVVWWQNLDGLGLSWSELTIETAIDGPRRIRVGDLDGDGDPDLVGVATNEDRVLWWRNDLSGGSGWSQLEIATLFGGARDARPADVDGDGDLDVIAVAGGENLVAWFENTDGSGASWDAHVVDGFFTVASDAVGEDLDGDGDIDIVAVASGGDRLAWWENIAGDGSAWSEATIQTGYTNAGAVAVADLDGDGDHDVVAGSSDSGQLVSWWRNDTLHRSAVYPFERTVDPSFDGAHQVVVADIDGDGLLDTVAVAEQAGEIAWWRNPNDPTGTWTKTVVTATFAGARSVAVADLDRDGDPDLVAAADGDDAVRWWQNTAGNGSAWSEHAIDPTFAGARSVAVADFDGDGYLDVAGAAFDGNRVVWWRNEAGDGSSWTQTDVDTNFRAPRCLRAADIDQDGDIDLAAASWTTGELAWFANGGSGSFSARVMVHTADVDGYRRFEIVDLDRDGDLDMLAAATFEDRIEWFENDSLVWTAHDVDAAYDSPRDAHAADLDSDGDLDVAGVSGDLSQVAWWENAAGDESVWTFHSVDDTVSIASSIEVADLDRDGDLDLLATAEHADAVRWWDNRGGQLALPTTDAVVDTTPLQGTEVAALRVKASHRGRSGDGEAELTTFDLRFTDGDDVALTNDELNALVTVLRIYLENGDDTSFDGRELLVQEEGPFSLDEDGGLTVTFVLPNIDLVLAYGTDKVYWLTLELAADAASQTPDSLRLQHRTASTSTAQMYASGLAEDPSLRLEYAADATSSVLTVNGAPTLDSAVPDQVAILDQLFELDLTTFVSDPDGDPLAFSLTDSFGFLSLTADGSLDGTPLAAQLGGSPYTVEVTLNDGVGGVLDLSFQLTIDSPPFVITAVGERRVVTGRVSSLDISIFFDDPDGDSLTFSATGLPDTLAMSADGVIAGVPAEADQGLSPFSVTVTVVDPLGASTQETFDLQVLPAEIFDDGFESGDTTGWASTVS